MENKDDKASEAKERIEKDAKAYSMKINCIDGTATFDYIAGATAEYNRAQEEITRLKAELEREIELRKELVGYQLSEYKEVIKELLPLAEDGYKLAVKNGSHQEFLLDDREVIDRAKKLIEK